MISIIVPIYNAGKYLDACIGSLLAQSVRELQIILVDDGSTDNSKSVAQRYAKTDPRVELYEQPHAGQSAARNNGLAHAKGEFIAFVDADDSINPDWCEKHLASIEGVDYVQSGHPLHRYRFTVVWGRLYRRQAISEWKFAEGMIYEDVLWSVDLWLSGAKCRIIDYDGYRYTANPDSTTSRPHPDAQRKVFQALRAKAQNASCKGKLIVYYTMIRLKLHYWKNS